MSGSPLSRAAPAAASRAVSARRASPLTMRSRWFSLSSGRVTAFFRPRSSLRARRSRARRSSSVRGSRVRRRERDRSGGDHREVRVLRGRRDQGHPAVLDGREQGVLLGLAEAVDLVQEEDGLLAEASGGAAGAVDDRADLLDARGDRGQLHEPLVGRLRDDVREGRLAGAGRAPEDHRGGSGGAARALADQSAQGRARLQQVLLAHHLVQGARAHPHRQGTAGRVLLLAFFRGGGE